MKNSKKAWSIFKKCITLLFIMFLILYFQVETGSVNPLKSQTIITNENLKKFEKDVKEGKPVDIINYTIQNNIDTSNIISDAGYLISEKTSRFIGVELKNIINILKKLFS